MGSTHGTEAAEAHGIRRSPHWPTVEKHFLASQPRCAFCNEDQHQSRIKQVEPLDTRGLQVHHEFPFHFCILLGRPDLEVDPRNLTVLCEDERGVSTQDHHNVVGHLRNFQSYNPTLRTAINTNAYQGWSKAKLLSDPNFLAACSALPPTWAHMTQSDKDAFRAILDATFPL